MPRSILVATVTLATAFSLAAHAEPGLRARASVVSDGNGNVHGISGSGFNTAAGGQGLRTTQFNRTSSGGFTTGNNAQATTRNGGSAVRSGTFTGTADGTASGERSTTLTNASTGVSYDGSTTYTKGSGVSRSASCKDAAGNTVSCGTR